MPATASSPAAEIAASLAADDRLHDLGLQIADLEALSLPLEAAQTVAAMRRSLERLQTAAAALPALLS